MTPFGGNEFPGGGGGGGGGAALPTPQFAGLGVYWNGTAWVATATPLVIASSASEIAGTPVQIPGLSGDPDIIPASPSAANDEFDQDFNGVSGPWIAFDAPDTVNTSDLLSHLHISKNSPGNANPNLAGIYKAAPAMPFTVTAKLADVYLKLSANRAGLFIADVAPAAASGNILDWGISQTVTPNPTLYSNKYTGYTGAAVGGASGPNLGVPVRPPMYFRILCTSATSILISVSYNGKVWNDGTVTNPGFAANFVGLHCAPQVAGGRGEAMFDWIRFT